MSIKSESPIDSNIKNNEIKRFGLIIDSDSTSSSPDNSIQSEPIAIYISPGSRKSFLENTFNQESMIDENLSIYDIQPTSQIFHKKSINSTKSKDILLDDAENKLDIESSIAKLDLQQNEYDENDEENENFFESNDKPDTEFEFKLQQKEFDDEENEKIAQDLINDTSLDNNADDDESSMPIEMNEQWQMKSKHVFILSDAGKPIYSLHGNEVQLITFMGLLQALVSIVESDNENKLKYVLAGDHKVVFLHKSHLIFVCISNESEKCVEQLELELTYVYNQILSVVTLSLIEKVFARYNSYDLRNKLTGTEKLLTNIINRCENDYGMLLNCVNSYPLQMDVRDQIARIIAQQISSFRYVLFGLLLFDNKLVALIRPKTKNIHPIDVHLIVNVVTGLDTPKSAEFTWYPICLPNFNSSGMMYAYISHLDEQCKTCLILLTGLCDEDQSFELNECRKRIQQKLQTQSINQILNMKYIDQSLRLDQIGVPELKHFLFKDNKIFQYFVSEYALPYSASTQQQKRIYNIYQKLYHKLHNQTNNLKIIYMQQKYETILGWMTSSFEIYATFSSLVTKEKAVHAVNKLLEFTQKNKNKIFLNSMPTLQR